MTQGCPQQPPRHAAERHCKEEQGAHPQPTACSPAESQALWHWQEMSQSGSGSWQGPVGPQSPARSTGSIWAQRATLTSRADPDIRAPAPFGSALTRSKQRHHRELLCWVSPGHGAAAVLDVPRAMVAASGVAADSHPTTHAKAQAGHSRHRAAPAEVGTQEGKNEGKEGCGWDEGQVTSGKGLSELGKNAKEFHTVKKQLRPEGKREKETESKQQRGGQREKEMEKKERQKCMSRSQEEGQGRLVARPFMARTRRGRQGVSPGT